MALPQNENDLKEIFLQAIKDNNIDLIKLLIKNGFNINVFDRCYDYRDNNYALIDATRAGRFKIVEILLNNGADPNSAHGYSALCIAADHGHIELTKLLIEKGAKINHPENRGDALYMAANRGHLAIVKLLANQDQNIDVDFCVDYKGYYNHSISIASKNIRKDTVIYLQRLKWLKKNFPGNWDKLRKYMYEHQDDNNIANYLKSTTIRDANSNLPLVLAIKENNQDMINYLLKNNIIISDDNKNAPVDIAILKNIIKNKANNITIRKLFKWFSLKYIENNNLHIGNDLKAKRYSLFYAIAKNNYQMVKQLLEEGGVDVNSPWTTDNDTPLHLAARLGHMKIANLLVKHGASPTKINNAGNSALELKHIGFLQIIWEVIIKPLIYLRIISRKPSNISTTHTVNHHLANGTKDFFGKDFTDLLIPHRKVLSFSGRQTPPGGAPMLPAGYVAPMLPAGYKAPEPSAPPA